MPFGALRRAIVMVIFHEGDHARAAVAAAQGIHRRAGELNAESGGAGLLAMHIGVNTGPALLGATKIEGRAGTRWTYTASEVVLSESTRGRLGGAFTCEDLGTRELKNVDAPVHLYRLS